MATAPGGQGHIGSSPALPCPFPALLPATVASRQHTNETHVSCVASSPFIYSPPPPTLSWLCQCFLTLHYVLDLFAGRCGVLLMSYRPERRQSQQIFMLSAFVRCSSAAFYFYYLEQRRQNPNSPSFFCCLMKTKNPRLLGLIARTTPSCELGKVQLWPHDWCVATAAYLKASLDRLDFLLLFLLLLLILLLGS